MRKLLRLCKMALLMIMMMFLLSGCTTPNIGVRMQIDITIKRNQKVDASLYFAVLQEMIDYGLYSLDEIREMKGDGWDYKLVTEDNYVGYVFTIQDKELSEIVSSVKGMEALGEENDDRLSISKNGMIYTFSGRLTDDTSDLSLFRNSIIQNNGYVKFSLHLPEKPITSNATYVSDEGKTLTWDLLSMGENQQIYAEFRVIPMYIIYILIASAVLIPILLIMIIILRVKRKKKEARIAAAEAAARKKAEAAAALEARKKAAATAALKKRALAAAQAANQRAAVSSAQKKST